MTNGHPDAEWQAIDSLHISVFSFGSTAFGTPLGVVVLPVLVLAVAPEELKNTYLGLLGLTGLLVAIVVQPAVGYVSDRTFSPWGHRMPYIVVGGLLTCLAVFLLGVASSYIALAASLVVIQLCINTALGPYQALIRDLAPRARRGIVSSFKVMGDSSGGMVFLVLVAFLLAQCTGAQNVAWLWLSLGVLSVILGASTAWIAIGIRSKEASVSAVAAASPTSRLQREAHPRFGWFLGSRFCTFAALAILQTYALFFLRDVVDLPNPARAVGIMTLVIGGSILVAVYPFGRLSDRVGRKGVIVAAAMVGAGGAFTLLLAASFLQVILIGALIGVAAGAFLGASWAMATDLVSSGHTAQQMGIANASAVGGTALAKLAGPGVDLLNRAGGELGYSTLLVACGVLFVLGALLLLRVPGNMAPCSPAAARP